MYEDMEMMEDLEAYEDLEDFEDFEDFEEMEDFEDYEDFEDFEDLEDFEDFEADPFLGNVVKRVARVARRVPWRQLVRSGLNTVASNLEGEMETFNEMAYLAEMAAEAESETQADQFLGAIGGLASSLLGGLAGQQEQSDLEDFEDYEDEADPFFPALLPLAAKVLPMAAPLLKRGVQAIGKALREADPSKQAVKALPVVAAKAATSLAKQAKAGKPITPKRVQATLAKEAQKTLSNPKQVAKAIKVNRQAAKKAVQQAKTNTRQTKQVLRRQRLLRAK